LGIEDRGLRIQDSGLGDIGLGILDLGIGELGIEELRIGNWGIWDFGLGDFGLRIDDGETRLPSRGGDGGLGSNFYVLISMPVLYFTKK
jgi:hypothetical protein